MTETAFGYTRLSQKSDEQSGLSIENQAYEITQHCIRNNIKLLKIWNEFHLAFKLLQVLLYIANKHEIKLTKLWQSNY